MSIETLWGSLKTKKTEVESQKKSGWMQFVIDVADGIQTEPEAILIALEQFGKTPEELEATVTKLTHRRELAATIVKAEKGKEESDELTKQIVAANAVLKIAEDEHARIVGPLRNRVEFNKTLKLAAFSAHQELITGAGAKPQFDGFHRESEALSKKREEIGTAIKYRKDRLERNQRAEQSGRQLNAEDAAERVAENERLQSEIANLEQDHIRNQEQRDAVDLRLKEFQDSLLDPVNFY